jgi:CHAD domain-containing protein
MTSGLAGYIATATDEQSWDSVLASALEALAADFTVLAEQHHATQRRTWLDTFDWRLHRAGLLLEYVTAAGSGELLLTDRDGEQAGQPVTGWQASRPQLFSDLPDGPVTARVVNLLTPRALLPVITLTCGTASYRLLNADTKTVARLLVEYPALAVAPNAKLAPRLFIAEVRGYPAQARRAARILAATPGIGPALERAGTEALRAQGGHPGDYSNKVDARITAAMPAPQAAATILLRLLDTVEANVTGVLRDTDSEFLHDLRVSTRRTRSAVKLFGDVLTSPRAGRGRLTADDIARFAAEFKWVGDVTTPTRDLDVHLLDFEDTKTQLHAAKPDDLEPFRGYLEQRRRKEFRALTRALKEARFTGLCQEWRDRLTAIRDQEESRARASRSRSGESGSPAGETAATLSAERTRRTFTKVAKRGAAITQNSPHESLHDLRKRCKELRYALEFFAPLHDPAVYGKVVGDLKRLQDCLGEFQDTEVQIAEIRALATAMLAAGEAPAVTLLAMGELTAGLASRQRAAREDFERRFAAFADAEGQRRMSVLLRGGRGGAG